MQNHLNVTYHTHLMLIKLISYELFTDDNNQVLQPASVCSRNFFGPHEDFHKLTNESRVGWRERGALKDTGAKTSLFRDAPVKEAL